MHYDGERHDVVEGEVVCGSAVDAAVAVAAVDPLPKPVTASKTSENEGRVSVPGTLRVLFDAIVPSDPANTLHVGS